MYKKPTNKQIYHVFSHNYDDYLEIDEANKLYKELVKERGSARLYSTNWNKVDGVFEDEDCIKSFGSFPM